MSRTKIVFFIVAAESLVTDPAKNRGDPVFDYTDPPHSGRRRRGVKQTC